MGIMEFILSILLGGIILNIILLPFDYFIELYWFKICWDEPFTIKEYLKTWK